MSKGPDFFPALIQSLLQCNGMEEAFNLRDQLKASLFPQDVLEPDAANLLPVLLDTVRAMPKKFRFIVFQVLEESLHLALPEENTWGFTPIRRRFHVRPQQPLALRARMLELLPYFAECAWRVLDGSDLGSAASLSRVLLIEPRSVDPGPVLENLSCATGDSPCAAIVALARIAAALPTPYFQGGPDHGRFLSYLSAVLESPGTGPVSDLAEAGLTLGRADVDRMPWAEGAWLGIAAEWIRRAANGERTDTLAALSGLFVYAADRHVEPEEDFYFEWSIPSLIGHHLAVAAFAGHENRTHFLLREEMDDDQFQALRTIAKYPNIEIPFLRYCGIFDHTDTRYLGMAPRGPADDLFEGEFQGNMQVWPAWKWVWMAVEWDRYRATFPADTKKALEHLRTVKGGEWFQSFREDAAGGAYSLHQFLRSFP